ncbi:hypothetical protein PMI05_01374 [Brevibacillus sp. BC25]|nr:hypothetical protein PMI05_01374 [Brevibacillus sp. BC25]
MESFAQVRLRIDRFEPHVLHETAYTLTIDLEALISKESGHTPITKVRVLHIDLIDTMHDPYILFALTFLIAGAVDACPVDAQQIGLALNRDLRCHALPWLYELQAVHLRPDFLFEPVDLNCKLANQLL